VAALTQDHSLSLSLSLLAQQAHACIPRRATKGHRAPWQRRCCFSIAAGLARRRANQAVQRTRHGRLHRCAPAGCRPATPSPSRFPTSASNSPQKELLLHLPLRPADRVLRCKRNDDGSSTALGALADDPTAICEILRTLQFAVYLGPPCLFSPCSRVPVSPFCPKAYV
jgi:hypothetical protein